MGIKAHLEANFDYEIVDEFLDHYSLMVDSMEVMIIDLSKPELHDRSVDGLFRVFHTIKSASAFLGLESMRKLSALVEDTLETLRESKKQVNEETINWLLEIHDMFAVWNDDLRFDNELSKVKFSLLKIPDLDR
ncbi:MAG: Hpt domain-containing protein [Campylobacterales bacterium]|nr:Hpt domain-containing protein [Campylobacterales bacterium]